MLKRKKLLAALLAGTMMLSLVGCGKKADTSGFTKEGIRAGMGNSMNISRKATPESIAEIVSLWVRLRLAARVEGIALALGSDIKNTLLFSFENTLDALTSPR